MSYILDALKKSQGERERDRVPTLELPDVERLPGAAKEPVRLFVAALFGGIAAALAVAVLMATWERGSPLPSPPPAPSATTRLPGDLAPPEPPAAPPSAVHSEAAPRREPPPALRRAVTPARSWSELPAALRGAIGELELNVHIYSDTPSERFAFINGKPFEEGDRLGPDLALEAITPTGVVLAYRGERFRLEM